jgi:hypothetical protein
MNTRRDKIAVWFSALAVVLACIPLGGTSIPTVDPNQIDQFIVQTANAALTQTARALPTSTGTATITPTHGTFTPSPTFTATVLFILPSATDTITPTFALGGGGTSENDFACEVLSVTPVSGTSFRGRDTFDVTWRVRNIGQRKWNEDVVRYAFESGDAMHTVASYVLQSDVSRGDTLDVVVEMRAPEESGTYSTTWALRRGENSFCQMFLTINVR